MKPLIIILFMNLVIVNIQGQNITNDSICVYSTNISELSEFLNRKIEIYKNEPDSLVHKDLVGYGVLTVDSSKIDKVIIRFNYYDFREIFENSISKAWGVWFVKSMPIFLCGVYDKRIFKKISGKIRVETREPFNGPIDPFFIYIRLKFGSHESESFQK